MPYRVAAPPDVDLPEAEHPYAAVLRRERARARLVGAALGAAALALVVTAFARPSAAKRPSRGDDRAREDRAVAAIAGARARAGAEQSRFAAAITAALRESTAAREDLGPCPVTLREPSGLSHPFPLLVTSADDTASLPSQALADLLADVHRADAHARSGRFEEASLYATALARPERLAHEVVVVASRWTKPRVTSSLSYEPGELVGRAFLYDFASGKVECAADVRAKSSARVGFAYAATADAPPSLGKDARLAASLDDDMTREVERAVARALRFRAGPPLR